MATAGGTLLADSGCALHFGGVALYFAQGRLMFPGTFIHNREQAIVKPAPDREIITLDNVGGHRVSAVFGATRDAGGRPAADPSTCPTLLFLYGNGDCVATSMNLFRKFRRLGANVLIPEYPGYPMSEGTPGEQAFYDTADAGYAYLTSRAGIDPSQIVSSAARSAAVRRSTWRCESLSPGWLNLQWLHEHG